MKSAETDNDQATEINYRVGRRGSSLAKISTADRYELMQRVMRDVMQAVEGRNRLERAVEAKADGKRTLPGTVEPIDRTLADLRGVENFDPVAYIERQVHSRMQSIDKNHAEIEVLLKVRDMIDALENPPEAGDQSSTKRTNGS